MGDNLNSKVLYVLLIGLLDFSRQRYDRESLCGPVHHQRKVSEFAQTLYIEHVLVTVRVKHLVATVLGNFISIKMSIHCMQIIGNHLLD